MGETYEESSNFEGHFCDHSFNVKGTFWRVLKF
jgi:hypothetical protein